jgi:hypothetical protein
LATLNAQLQE